MNKNFYLTVLILLATICGIVNLGVSHLMTDSKSDMVFSASDKSATQGLEVDMTKEFDTYYAGENPFWAFLKERDVIISEFDPIMRQIASDKGYDWRFIAAIACAESQFNQDIVSHAGAVGLMQIMPIVARQFKVDQMHIGDPHTNVALGVELLDYIGRTIRFSSSISEKDRLSIMLASYNCGMGHVLDARRLAVKYGENHNSWSVVSRYLTLKNEPGYYQDEVVRCGQFTGNRQTVGFVNRVLRYYDSYCEIAMM